MFGLHPHIVRSCVQYAQNTTEHNVSNDTLCNSVTSFPCLLNAAAVLGAACGFCYKSVSDYDYGLDIEYLEKHNCALV
jgi:hypothetical protein